MLCVLNMYTSIVSYLCPVVGDKDSSSLSRHIYCRYSVFRDQSGAIV